MKIRDYLSVLWRRKWVIILTLMITFLVVVVGTYFIEPSYSAVAKIRVAASAASADSYSDFLAADRLLKTYVEIANSGPIHEDLKKQLNITKNLDIEVVNILETEIIQISVADSNPQVAMDVANGMAQILVTNSGDYYGGSGVNPLDALTVELQNAKKEMDEAKAQYDRQVGIKPPDEFNIAAASKLLDFKTLMYTNILQRYETAKIKVANRENIVTIVELASFPNSPTTPNYIMNYSLGIIGGLIGGLLLAFLFENMDTKLYTTEEIESVAAYKTLGRIPFNGKVDGNEKGFSPVKESFNQLSTNLITLNKDIVLHSMLITSPAPNEGKSFVISNLAQSLSRSGKRVLVVDCDFRIPSIHKNFKIANDIGLSSVLKKTNSLDEVIQETSFSGVKVITSGPTSTHSAELLGSGKMKEIIKTLTEKFDIVILDAPAMLPVADAGIVANLVDAVMVVVKRGQTTEDALKLLKDQLHDLKVKVIGLIINGDSRMMTYR